MVDFNKPVGNAGTMTIRDDGATVSFIISCTDGATNVGSYVWSGVVNGTPVGGSINLPAGFGSRVLGSWGVSTSQTVSFHQNATGTSGLGGAADHSAAINRTPASTVPGPPDTNYPPNPDFITPTSAYFKFSGAGTGGSPITGFRYQVSKHSEFLDGPPLLDAGMFGAVTVTNLDPANQYYWHVQAGNANGWGPWSATIPFVTATCVRVDSGSAFGIYVVDVSDGTSWIRQRVDVSDGSSWKPAG